jgi:hypothetical protein
LTLEGKTPGLSEPGVLRGAEKERSSLICVCQLVQEAGEGFDLLTYLPPYVG